MLDIMKKRRHEVCVKKFWRHRAVPPELTSAVGGPELTVHHDDFHLMALLLEQVTERLGPLLISAHHAVR